MSSNPEPGRNQRALVVVTGASRGIGRAIANEFASTLSWSDEVKSVRVVLVARSTEALEQVKCNIEQGRKGNNNASFEVEVSVHTIDLSFKHELTQNFLPLLRSLLPSSQYEHAILINNAGLVSPLSNARKLHEQYDAVCRSIEFNVSSSTYISSLFCDLLGPNVDDEMRGPGSNQTTIVNISSLCAAEPFKSMSVYCAGKAARDMFHRTLAEETKDSNIKVLNYAPGPVDTDMVSEMIQSTTINDDIKTYMSTSRKEGKLVKAEDTARKLVGIVLESEFESGSHIDYFDS